MSRGFRACIAWLVVALLAAGCGPPGPRAAPDTGGGPAGSGPPALPKRITAAMMSDPPSISSSFVSAGSGSIQGGDALEDLVNSGLTVVDHVGLLRPQLAEAAPTIENGLWKMFPDGRMETTWKIRGGALWHDGAPFTSEDLLFTVKLGQDRELPLFRHSGFDSVEGAEAPDARTIVVKWKRPNIQADAMFTRQFAFPRPSHLLQKAHEDSKESIVRLPYWTDEYVGTGPFKLRQWVAGSHLVLEAYERYILGRPKINEVEVRFIPDSKTLMANLLAGRVELTLGRNLQLSEAMQIRDQWTDGRIGVGIKNWIALWPQLLNPTPAVVLDVQFRRALLHAIDRQQLVDTLEYGMVPIAHTFLSPTDPMYREIEPSIVRYDYDPRRATQLIEGLGYARGGDGIFRDGGRQQLSLEVRTNPGHEERVLAIADDFKKIGIAAEPSIPPDVRRGDREYNVTYPGVRLWRLPNDAWGLYRYHSKETPLPENRFNGGNRSRYMNPAFDALIDRYMTTISPQERTPVLGQIVHHMTDQLTAMGIYYNTEPVMIGNRLMSVTARDVGETTEAWNAHEWELR